MIHAAAYRAKAEDCARRAREAQDEYHRKNFQKLAAMWFEMAEKCERREAGEQREIAEALATIRHADELVAQDGNSGRN